MEWSRIVLWTLVAALAVWTFRDLRPGQAPPSALPAPGVYVTVENERIYVEELGSGQNVVLLLHGFPYHREAFSALWERSWPGCRLVRMDLPGLGLSDLPEGAYASPDDLALSVKLCLDQMGIKRVRIVGHDLGGGVALILAARYPSLVTRLVLIAPDSSAGGAGDRDALWWRIPGIATGAALVLPVRPWLRSMLAEAWGRPDQAWVHLVEQYAQPLTTWTGRRNAVRVRRGRYGFNYLRFEEQLKVPMLVIWGDRDRVVDPIQGRAWAEGLASPARFQALNGVGHLPAEEAPDAVSAALQAFFLVPSEAAGEPEVSTAQPRRPPTPVPARAPIRRTQARSAPTPRPARPTPAPTAPEGTAYPAAAPIPASAPADGTQGMAGPGPVETVPAPTAAGPEVLPKIKAVPEPVASPTPVPATGTPAP